MSFVAQDITGSEPIALDVAKDHCYVTGSKWDTYITSLISAARRYAESQTWLILRKGTYTYNLDSFPNSKYIKIDKYPVSSISSLDYFDGQGNQITLDTAKYFTDVQGYSARIQIKHAVLNSNAENWPINTRKEATYWPVTNDQPNAVQISLTAGFDGSSPRLTIPETITEAMLLMIKHWFDNRSSVEVSAQHRINAVEVPQSAKMLLNLESMRVFV